VTTNPLRKIIVDEKLGDFRFFLYDTGAAYLNWGDRDQLAMAITQAQPLMDSGHLHKLFSLLQDEQNSKLASLFSGGIRLEFSPGKLEAVKFILDSELSSSAKLTYVISYLSAKMNLSQETLEEIFEKRPEPFLELNSSLSTTVTSSSIRAAIFPGFHNPGDYVKNEEDYIQFNKLSGFLASISPLTYSKFKELHEGERFIPHRHSGVNYDVFKPMSGVLMDDLYPREYVRYATYFGGAVSSELRAWARSRFDEGVETFKEAQDRGKVKFQGNKDNNAWYPTIQLLSVKEAEAFEELLKVPNGISSVFNGVDKPAASIFAYYFVKGGPDKLMELALHVSQHNNQSRERMSYSMWGMPQANLKWSNPFSGQVGKTVKLTPYVKALEEPDFESYPLDWLLATQ